MGFAIAKSSYTTPVGSQSPSQEQLAQSGASSHRFHMCAALFDPLTPFPAGPDQRTKGEHRRGKNRAGPIDLQERCNDYLGHMPCCPTRKHRQKWAKVGLHGERLGAILIVFLMPFDFE